MAGPVTQASGGLGSVGWLTAGGQPRPRAASIRRPRQALRRYGRPGGARGRPGRLRRREPGQAGDGAAQSARVGTVAGSRLGERGAGGGSVESQTRSFWRLF